MPSFEKTEKIETRIRQDLADRIPKEKGERNKFLNEAIEEKLDGPGWLKRGGSSTSSAKQAAARENGKKGGRPKKNLKDDFEIAVTKDGKPRTLKLENHGQGQYDLYIHYPDGQTVRARYQPECQGFPDLAFLAEKNGFEVVKKEM